MSEARSYPAGVTSWIDLESPDLDAAEAFYTALFGWTYERATPPEAPQPYDIVRLDGSDVAGMGVSAEGQAAAGWNTYIAVDDIEATCAAVGLAGGTVVDPPTPAGEGGIGAVCQDPSGVEFRLWQAKRRLGAQLVNAPGAWNFSDLHTADPAGAQAFYERVFPWRFVDMGFATMIQVPGYGDHLAATSDPDIFERQAFAPEHFADVVSGFAPAGTLGSGWFVSFSVADRDDTASLAESLGAQVLDREDSEWTLQAAIRDPQGATFIASEFLDPTA